MAPVPEAYFPSLDKCFSGDVQLLYALTLLPTMRQNKVLMGY